MNLRMVMACSFTRLAGIYSRSAPEHTRKGISMWAATDICTVFELQQNYSTGGKFVLDKDYLQEGRGVG